jgi:hypothetical protein
VLRGRRRQLQDGRNLTRAQPGQEYYLPAGKLKGIVMCERLLEVHPPKLGHFFRDLLAWVKEVQWGLILDVFLEREFRARKQTNRNRWLSNCSEPAGDRVAKLA